MSGVVIPTPCFLDVACCVCVLQMRPEPLAPCAFLAPHPSMNIAQPDYSSALEHRKVWKGMTRQKSYRGVFNLPLKTGMGKATEYRLPDRGCCCHPGIEYIGGGFAW
eukprot:scaffold19274_cov48-Cyclotella_meneghiniana.AAC.1